MRDEQRTFSLALRRQCAASIDPVFQQSVDHISYQRPDWIQFISLCAEIRHCSYPDHYKGVLPSGLFDQSSLTPMDFIAVCYLIGTGFLANSQLTRILHNELLEVGQSIETIHVKILAWVRSVHTLVRSQSTPSDFGRQLIIEIIDILILKIQKMRHVTPESSDALCKTMSVLLCETVLIVLNSESSAEDTKPVDKLAFYEEFAEVHIPTLLQSLFDGKVKPSWRSTAIKRLIKMMEAFTYLPSSDRNGFKNYLSLSLVHLRNVDPESWKGHENLWLTVVQQ